MEMASRSLRLVVDTENGRLTPGFRSIISTITPRFTVGDQIPVEVFLTKPGSAAGVGSQEVPFPAGCVLRVAVGEINKTPTAGAWSLSYDGDTTVDLAYNASASAVEDALNDLASITSAGGVTVSKVGDAYSIAFDTTGDKDPITGSAGTLVPLSAVSVQTLQEGGASEKEVVFVQVKVRPIAYQETFTDLASPTISRVGQTYEIAGAVKSGTYTLTVTYDGDSATTWDIPYNATVNQIEAAVQAALVSLDWNPGSEARPVRAVQIDGQEWGLSYWDSGSYLSNVDGSNLVGFAGKIGTLSINTAEALAFIGSEASRRATLEIEIEEAGERQTVAQASAEVTADVILAGAFEPTSLEEALSEAVANARFIRRDADQALDATTKNQIWENLLGVTTPSGVNIVDAINGAASPSSANVLATQSDLPNQSLNTTDSPTFAEVQADIRIQGGGTDTTLDWDGLVISGTNGVSPGTGGLVFADATTQTTAAVFYDQSLNVADSVTFADITVTNGVNSVLLGATTGLTFASTNAVSDIVAAAGPTLHSGGGGHIDANDYPDEIQVVINGVTYAIPSRAI